jgi:hypothetical protein
MQSLNRPPAVSGGRRGVAMTQPMTPALSLSARPARTHQGSHSSSVAARAGLLEAVLKPITTAGQVSVTNSEGVVVRTTAR